MILGLAAAVIAVIAIFTSPAPRTYHPVPFNCSQVAYGGGNIAPLCGQSYYSPTLPPVTSGD